MIRHPVRRLTPVVRLAPAKLNLTLAVLDRRPDGFHDLHSVMVPLELADVLSLAVTGGGADTLHVEGHDPGPAADNLVLAAIAAGREAVGAGWAGDDGGPAGPSAGPAPSLAVRLDKRIPIAAGLAGGSSDAAAALDGALELWGAQLDGTSRLAVAARLGSDVPFFQAGCLALVEGRGERVSPLASVSGEAVGILLVSPRIAVPTRDVFAAFDAGARPADTGAARASSRHLVLELARGLSSSQLVERAGVLASANDLVPATVAVVPELAGFRRSLTRLLARPVGQSGSGPTAWVLYPSRAAAESARDDVLAAIADGRLIAPGDAFGNASDAARGDASVAVFATTILTEGSP
jgi:4-diphosphocytidyl-2-C-methyl-D-erythritol kinase